MGSRKRCHSAGSGRMPSVSRRPTKNRSSRGDRPPGACLAAADAATYSAGDSAIRPAHAPVERMRVGAESEIGLQQPIFQVVPRLHAGPGEIRNLVARDAHLRQTLDGDLVEVGGQLVGRGVGRAVAHAAQAQFAAQAAVVIHFQHVDRDVLRRQALHPVERFAPAGLGLAGEAGDQIDIDIADAALAQQRDFRLRRSRPCACVRCARFPSARTTARRARRD